MKKFKRIYPFLGISLICIYWLTMFNHSSYIRDSFTCTDSLGYSAIKEIFTKKEIFDKMKNCSTLSINPNSIEDVVGPTFIFQKEKSQEKITNFENFSKKFNKSIIESDSVSTSIRAKMITPYFNITISRNVTAERNGLSFSIRQMINLESMDIEFGFLARVIVPIISTICVFTHRKKKKSLVAFIFSLLTILMHTFYNGKCMQLFRFMASVAWVLEFALMLGLHINAFAIVIPVLILTAAVAMLFFAFLFDASKWFKDLTTSYMVTISLMVGDHVIDTLNSIHGYGTPFFIRFIATCVFVLILVFVVMSSTGRPLNRLIHNSHETKVQIGNDE